VIVAVADRELPWGFFNFPSIRRAVSGQISVSWSMSPDNANSYGQATTGNSAVSSDEGKTWTRVERAPTGGGIVLSNGDRITITTPTAIPLADLDLPPVLATMQDGSNYNRLSEIINTINCRRSCRAPIRPGSRRERLPGLPNGVPWFIRIWLAMRMGIFSL